MLRSRLRCDWYRSHVALLLVRRETLEQGWRILGSKKNRSTDWTPTICLDTLRSSCTEADPGGQIRPWPPFMYPLLFLQCCSKYLQWCYLLHSDGCWRQNDVTAAMDQHLTWFHWFGSLWAQVSTGCHDIVAAWSSSVSIKARIEALMIRLVSSDLIALVDWM
jgi:hypothetical protein